MFTASSAFEVLLSPATCKFEKLFSLCKRTKKANLDFCFRYSSLSLIRYQEDYKALSLVSRDLRPFVPPPMAAQFLLDRDQLGFVCSDEGGNICIFNYMPEAHDSAGGDQLVLRAALNIGSPANGVIRVNGRQGDETKLADSSVKLRPQFLGHISDAFAENINVAKEVQTIVLATLDGSWAVVRPVNERAFRRLQTLQQLMIAQVPQSAGLHPRGARSLKPRRLQQHCVNSSRLVIDGNFVSQYLHLSMSDKVDLARASGSNRYQVNRRNSQQKMAARK